MVEKECLALVWACERFAQYLVGLSSFVLLTDHKPLVPILGKKSIDEVPLRCQRLILRLMRFNPEVRHVPGKEQHISDAQSRNPLPLDPETDSEISSDIKAHVDTVTATWPASPSRKEEISVETELDDDLQLVKRYIENGWPAYESSIPDRLKPYSVARNHLSIVEGFVTYDDRIVVPVKLQQSILNKLHESHQGLNKCLDNAQAAVWWPGMTTQLTNLIENYSICADYRPAARCEPLIPSELPSRPWHTVASDLFELYDKQYIVVVDKYSRWIEMRQLNSTTSASVIKQMKEIFAIHGIPEVVQSDNGPQFTSTEYKTFAETWGFKIVTSSPHFPQANGAAERSVQTCKKILRQTDPALAMMNYRNTPHSTTGSSPASALMGRRLRTRIPVLSKLLQPHTPDGEMRIRDENAKNRYKRYLDQRHGAPLLLSRQNGQPVIVKRGKEEKRSGIVETGDSAKRTYLIKTQTGMIRRNRKHIQCVPSYRETHHDARDYLEDSSERSGPDTNENHDRVDRPVSCIPDEVSIRRSKRNIKKPKRLIEGL